MKWLSKQHINYLLNGERKPSLDTLVKTYKVSVDWLPGVDHITTTEEYSKAEAELERLRGEYLALLERLIENSDTASTLEEVQRIKERIEAIKEMLGKARCACTPTPQSRSTSL